MLKAYDFHNQKDFDVVNARYRSYFAKGKPLVVLLSASTDKWTSFYYGNLASSVTIAKLGMLGYVPMQNAAIREVIPDTEKVSKVYHWKKMPQTPAQLLRQIRIMLQWVSETCDLVKAM